MFESPSCPQCVLGEGTFLGTLGHSSLFRCRDCGWDWSEGADENEDDCDDDGRFATDAEADEEAVSGEWDGQPDEMQEWHDFDPDC